MDGVEAPQAGRLEIRSDTPHFGVAVDDLAPIEQRPGRPLRETRPACTSDPSGHFYLGEGACVDGRDVTDIQGKRAALRLQDDQLDER